MVWRAAARYAPYNARRVHFAAIGERQKAAVAKAAI